MMMYTSAPKNGTMKIAMIQIAFQPPDMSLRRKMSAKIEMKIQISMNQKKKMTIDQTTSQNV